MFTGPTKAEAWGLAARCRDGIMFRWILGMRWVHLDEDTREITSGILVHSSRPPPGAVPDLYDGYTQEQLRKIARLEPGATLYRVIDEICTTRLCAQPDLDARDELRRRAEQLIRDRRLPRSKWRHHLNEIAEGLDARRIDVWQALRLGAPT